jgi:hypothetical protein
MENNDMQDKEKKDNAVSLSAYIAEKNKVAGMTAVMPAKTGVKTISKIKNPKKV